MACSCENDTSSDEEPPELEQQSKDSSDDNHSSIDNDFINAIEPDPSNTSLLTHHALPLAAMVKHNKNKKCTSNHAAPKRATKEERDSIAKIQKFF